MGGHKGLPYTREQAQAFYASLSPGITSRSQPDLSPFFSVCAGNMALAWSPYVSLRLGTASKSKPDLSPASSLNQPAAATPTALSVQSSGGG